jgi:hypothetical protein
LSPKYDAHLTPHSTSGRPIPGLGEECSLQVKAETLEPAEWICLQSPPSPQVSPFSASASFPAPALLWPTSRAAARLAARAAERDASATIERTLLDAVTFSEEQLDYAYSNFERSPTAALAFLTANTGICKKLADLGPLLDGIPDAVIAARPHANASSSAAICDDKSGGGEGSGIRRSHRQHTCARCIGAYVGAPFGETLPKKILTT